jgi:hypothetical protein
VVKFTTKLLYSQGETPWYSLKRSVYKPQNLAGHFGKQKNPLPLPRIEPQIFRPIAKPL